MFLRLCLKKLRLLPRFFPLKLVDKRFNNLVNKIQSYATTQELVPPTQVPFQFQEGKIDKEPVPPLIFLQGQVLRTKMLMHLPQQKLSHHLVCLPPPKLMEYLFEYYTVITITHVLIKVTTLME